MDAVCDYFFFFNLNTFLHPTLFEFGWGYGNGRTDGTDDGPDWPKKTIGLILKDSTFVSSHV